MVKSYGVKTGRVTIYGVPTLSHTLYYTSISDAESEIGVGTHGTL